MTSEYDASQEENGEFAKISLTSTKHVWKTASSFQGSTNGWIPRLEKSRIAFVMHFQDIIISKCTRSIRKNDLYHKGYIVT